MGKEDCTGLTNLSGAADVLKLHTRCLQVGLRDGRTGVSRGSFSSHMHFPPTISLGVGTQINPPLFSHRRACASGGWQFESTLQPCVHGGKKKYRPLFFADGQTERCVFTLVFLFQDGWASLQQSLFLAPTSRYAWPGEWLDFTAHNKSHSSPCSICLTWSSWYLNETQVTFCQAPPICHCF